MVKDWIIKCSAATGLSAALLVSLNIPAAFAQQYGQYGGNQPTALSVTKTVKDPTSSVFIKDITPSGSLLKPGDTVTWRIAVQNGGQTSFGFVDVTDTLPGYLTFVSGNGNYNSQNHQFTYRIENFTPGKQDTRDVVAQVVPKNQLPSSDGIICLLNNVKVQSNDNQTANDSSQACVRVGTGNSVTKLPSTGPNWLTYATLFIVVGAIAFVGFTFRKARH